MRPSTYNYHSQDNPSESNKQWTRRLWQPIRPRLKHDRGVPLDYLSGVVSWSWISTTKLGRSRKTPMVWSWLSSKTSEKVSSSCYSNSRWCSSRRLEKCWLAVPLRIDTYVQIQKSVYPRWRTWFDFFTLYEYSMVPMKTKKSTRILLTTTTTSM
jgi:hypothetical protein